MPEPQQRFGEDFYLPREIKGEGPHADALGGWIAFFPFQERYAQFDDPITQHRSIDPDPLSAQELINEYHGILMNGASFPQEYDASPGIAPPFSDTNAGVVGQAMVLPGRGTLRSTGPAYSGSLDALTLAVWVRQLEAGEGEIELVRWPGALRLSIKPQGAGVIVQTELASPTSVQTALNVDHALELSAWVHLAVTYDQSAGLLSLFVDGALVEQVSGVSGTITANVPTFEIGYPEGTTGAPTVLVDELALTRFAWTPRQIALAALLQAPRAPTDSSLTSGISFPVGTSPGAAVIPQDNAIKNDEPSLNKVLLGQVLFEDTQLSADGTVACASCHQADKAFTDSPQQVPIGVGGQPAGTRNTPSIQNALFRSRFFWDGRAHSLEAQVLQPFTNPAEHGIPNLGILISFLNVDTFYSWAFDVVFGAPASAENLAAALASFVRSIVVGNAAADRFVEGDASALTPSQQLGFELFMNKGRCGSCHRPKDQWGAPSRMTFLVNTGLIDPLQDHGNGYDEFVVPSLRDVARTPPYFHDGSVADLRSVLELYNAGERHPQSNSASLSPVTSRPIGFTDEEIDHVLAFLQALNSESI